MSVYSVVQEGKEGKGNKICGVVVPYQYLCYVYVWEGACLYAVLYRNIGSVLLLCEVPFLVLRGRGCFCCFCFVRFCFCFVFVSFLFCYCFIFVLLLCEV